MIEGSGSIPNGYHAYWIRIQEAQKHTDPDPQHCKKLDDSPGLGDLRKAKERIVKRTSKQVKKATDILRLACLEAVCVPASKALDTDTDPDQHFK